MKKIITTLLLLLVVCCIPTIVSAKELNEIYTNQNGVAIESNVYDKLCNIYSKNYIETITQDEYNNLMENNLKDIEIKEYTDEGIQTRGSYFSTNAKAVRLIKNDNYITMMASWKGVPNVKTYDVIAVRFDRATLNGTFTFKKTYVNNGNLNVSYDSSNQRFTNGFGSSFKVPNGTNLEISLTFMVSGSGTVYGSYQHASTATTLAESKKYTISSLGYGRVINFDASVRNKYDAMTGVDLSF